MFAEMPFPATLGTRYAYFLAQVMPKFTKFFGMTLLKSGHIESLKFTGMKMNQHSGET